MFLSCLNGECQLIFTRAEKRKDSNFTTFGSYFGECTHKKRCRIHAVFTFVLVVSSMLSAAQANEPNATDILETTGIKGGLIVHIGCGDGTLTAALHANDSYLVHGLDSDPCNIEQARAYIKSQGLYGKVSVEQFDGNSLPYIDNLVNLVVSEDIGVITMDEVQRVLCPEGVAYIKDGTGTWNMTVKPRPAEIDEWTHYRHSPNNNAVAQDDMVGPPRRIQWIGAPELARHHEHLPSLSAMVTSHGRVFYIFDDASSASILWPPKWRLIARDAFNGVVLWKKDIDEWNPHLWPLKSMPTTLPRRLVALGDDVFVTLGINSPVSQLSAEDGTQIKLFAGSEHCEEIVVTDDTLLALCLAGQGPLDDLDEERGEPGLGGGTKFSLVKQLMGGALSTLWLNADRHLIAYDRSSGQELWRVNGKCAPLSLASDGTKVYFHDSNAIVALDITNGNTAWTSVNIPIWEEYCSWYGASLVVCDGVVVFSGGENMAWQPEGVPDEVGVDMMTAFSAVDGHKLWAADHPCSGYRSPEDLIVAQDLVWAPNTTKNATSVLNGVNLHTGTINRTLNTNLHSFHHRCHPGRATEKYLLVSKVGVNVIPFDGGNQINDNWVRGSCGMGFLPANGMIYVTPNPCNCFAESKLNGFVALSGPDPALDSARVDSAQTLELEVGVNYGNVQMKPPSSMTGTWPTYRRNAARSGSTAVAPPYSFDSLSVDIGGKLTSPVAAEGKVFVASVDRHEVIALDAGTLMPVWTHVSGGRIDSPPTYVRGLLYFGSADGTLTCLKAETGEFVWCLRLGPTQELIVNKGSLESVWPVHGSVLYHNDLIYAIAGRSMFVDTGLYIYAVDPLTGLVQFSQRHELSGNDTSGMNAPPANSDILSASGNNIFMRTQAYNLQCNKTTTQERHLFAANGFLDDSWFYRAFWTYSKSWGNGPGGFSNTGNNNHSGRIMVHDDTNLYGFGRTIYGWASAFDYKLYKTSQMTGISGGKIFDWYIDIPILVRCIVKAGDKLCIAGPNALYNETDLVQTLDKTNPQPLITAQQSDEWSQSSELLVISTNDGTIESQITLGFAPVWDGMAVMDNFLFISGKDGSLYRIGNANHLPSVDADQDQSIYPMAAAQLDATVTDDGLPLVDPCDPCSPTIGVTTTWTKFDGPGEVTFDDPCVVDTNAWFSQWGHYTLRLTAFDGAVSSYDDTDVFVYRPGDLDGDNDLDRFDLKLFVDEWLASECDYFNDWCNGTDQTASGKTDMADYAIITLNCLLMVTPRNLDAIAGDSKVSLDWDDNTEADLDHYDVYRSTTSGGNYSRIDTNIITSDYVDNTVTNGITYYYVVKAVNNNGHKSDYSNEASASPQVALIGHYSFDIGSELTDSAGILGDLTLVNGHAGGNDVTFQNGYVTFTATEQPRASGDLDYLQAPNAGKTSMDDWSLLFWVRDSEVADNLRWQGIASSQPNGDWQVHCENDATGDVGVPQNRTTFGSISDGAWHHVAVVHTGGGGTPVVYFDAELVSPNNWASGREEVQNFLLGSSRDRKRQLTGDVDEVKIYRCVLSQAEVQQIMDSGI